MLWYPAFPEKPRAFCGDEGKGGIKSLYRNLLTMAVTKCTAQNLNVTVNTNKQIVGFTYDSAGNLHSDGSKAYTWDAENRPKTAAGIAYTFDGTNTRVKKGTNDFYWFSAASCKHPLFGRSTSAGVYTDEYVHFNGQPVGYRDDTAGAVYHIVTDETGSVRSMTNSTGVKQFESDYYPQGGQRVITATKDSLLKFQAKQLDTESGLENAARLYNPATARFLSVAARPAIKTPHPQALNKVSVPAAKPLNAFTSSVGSILSSFQSSLSPYRQCAQTVWSLGLVFTNDHQIDDGWVEILCGVPDLSDLIQFDSVTRYHLLCNSDHVLPKDKCACHCADSPDNKCQELCEKCFPNGFKLHDACLCSCKAALGEGNAKECEKVCKNTK